MADSDRTGGRSAPDEAARRERYPPDDPRAWVQRARRSLTMAKFHVPGGLLEDSCYWAQQAAETAIKGVMLARGIAFPFTHDLEELLAVLQGKGESVPETVPRAATLTRYFLETRYPNSGPPVSEEEYRDAVEVAEAVVEWADATVAEVRAAGDWPTVEAPAAPAESADAEGTPVDPEVLHDLIRRVVEVAEPEKIILFGSAVHGRMGPDSDIDVLVVKAGATRTDGLAGDIYMNLGGLAEAVDMVVATPEQLERYRDSYGMVIREALREGRVIYEAELP